MKRWSNSPIGGKYPRSGLNRIPFGRPFSLPWFFWTPSCLGILIPLGLVTVKAEAKYFDGPSL